MTGCVVMASKPVGSANNATMPELELFAKRALPQGQCSSTEECWDKSCCSVGGWCGRDPDHCGNGVTPNPACYSNCGAKAECGRGAEVAGTECPLNVCCGGFGYCGTTEEFCTTTGSNPCQSNCPQPGSTGQSGGNVRDLVIGYFGTWSLTRRGCAQRAIEDIPVDSLTHLNFAFGYIKPSTYEIYPMPNVATSSLASITNLKQKAPGLKIWLALGGWTFSDNGTDTQAVWGDLSSTPAKRRRFLDQLHTFMEYWGFDGVDIDWEYPGASDRMGTVADSTNFVLLLSDMRAYFDEKKPDWGISFTAPTSYWYLRWFPIDQMYQYVNWINLMSYDLHGSWDSPETWIGSFVYAHTNLTEIDQALNLFWRNGVPANKINLGIGFYGRSYTLSDVSCDVPGCAFARAGTAGTCTGEGGVLSYAEIESMKKYYGFTPKFDKETAVKYFTYNTDQWVSYDDDETLQMKVDFAQEKGLLGLMIWAIDLDTKQHDALRALLGGKLGIFRGQNGVRDTITDDWDSVSGTACVWSDCNSAICPAGFISAKAEQWCHIDTVGATQVLCCPVNNTPDPNTCHWDIGGYPKGSPICPGSCASDQVSVATSSHPMIDGSHTACFISGKAQYCCDISRTKTTPVVCTQQPECISITNGQPESGYSCPTGMKFVSYMGGKCKGGKWNAICCNSDDDTSKCSWSHGDAGKWCEGAQYCSVSSYTRYFQDSRGGGGGCRYSFYQNGPGVTPWYDADLTFCCPAFTLHTGTINLGVPLANLFPTPGPSSNVEQLGVELDKTAGGKSSANTQNPNDSAFGFFILSGPKNEITTMNKRDGSHWELFNCHPTTEKRQTVQAICTDTSSESNCHDVFEDGAEHTVIEMPDGCGPGRYAMVVSLARSQNYSIILPRHLEGRRGIDRRVYDLTFDYDFTAVNKRASTNVLMRIDYSDDPGYWEKVVAAPGNQKQKRQQEREVKEEHGGDYKSWIEHTWHKEKRSMDMEELHARWFSGEVYEWFTIQKKVSMDINVLSHELNDKIRWYLFKQNLDCKPYGIDEMFFEAYADLNIHANLATGLTLIGTLGNLQDFSQHAVWFRSAGKVDVELVFRAFAKMSFHTGQVELFGVQNFGSPFRVPGLVTIGPNFKLVGQISGEAVMQFQTSYKLDVIGWDFSQRYPAPGTTDDTDSTDTVTEEPAPGFTGPNFDNPIAWNVDAKGEIVVHLIPQFTLGIAFDSDKLANAEVILGVDAQARMYGNLEVGSTQNFKVCYGADSNLDLYAELSAPTLFGLNLSQKRSLKKWGPFDIYPYTCLGTPSSKFRRDIDWDNVPAIGESY